MTQRASESLVAVLIRIGLLLALAIMLMAENAQAQAPQANPHTLSPAGLSHCRPGPFTRPQA
jgi:type III secretory pathway component EscT